MSWRGGRSIMAEKQQQNKKARSVPADKAEPQTPGGEGMNARDLRGGGGGDDLGATVPGPGARAGGAYGGAGAPAGTGTISQNMDGGALAPGSTDPLTGDEQEHTPAEAPFADVPERRAGQ